MNAILECFPFVRTVLASQTGHSVNRAHYFEGMAQQKKKLEELFQNGTFCLQTDWSGQPVLINGKRTCCCCVSKKGFKIHTKILPTVV